MAEYEGEGKTPGWHYVSDLCRGKVYCHSTKDVRNAYNCIFGSEYLKIVRVKPKFYNLEKKKPQQLCNVTMNVCVYDCIVAEIQLELIGTDDDCKKQYTANHYIYELLRAKTTYSFIDTINKIIYDKQQTHDLVAEFNDDEDD